MQATGSRWGICGPNKSANHGEKLILKNSSVTAPAPVLVDDGGVVEAEPDTGDEPAPGAFSFGA